MSFITQCPACRTHFKIQENALVASAGKGRCSACQHIFNAFEHRYAPDVLETPIEPDAIEYPPAVEIEDTENSASQTPSFSEAYTLEDLAEEVLPEPLPVIEVPETLFQKNRMDWSKLIKPLLAAALLLLLLLAQSAMFFRTTLVTHYPRSYPLLVGACKLLNCAVELPHRVALIQIEDHSLRSDPQHADVLVLEGLIKNGAPYAQAYPLLQLTLTSKPDFPVANRSFSPEEYLPKETDIAAGMAAGSTVNVHLNLGIAGIQSNTYQLTAKN
jgi:predicted Zn finger-like uncharacterized protein